MKSSDKSFDDLVIQTTTATDKTFCQGTYRAILKSFWTSPIELQRQCDPKGLYAAEQTSWVTAVARGTPRVELPLAPHL